MNIIHRNFINVLIEEAQSSTARTAGDVLEARNILLCAIENVVKLEVEAALDAYREEIAPLVHSGIMSYNEYMRSIGRLP